MNKTRILLGAALWLLVGTAQATVLSFDFRNGGTGNAGSELNFSQGGVDLTVTASDLDDNARELWLFDQAGLGVAGGTGNNTAGTGESLVFELSPLPVDLGFALVLDVTADSQFFDLFVDGVFSQSFELTGGAGGANPPDANVVDLSPFAMGGSLFEIVAGDGPGLTIASLEVVTAHVAEPLPLALMFGGLIAFGMARRLQA